MVLYYYTTPNHDYSIALFCHFSLYLHRHYLQVVQIFVRCLTQNMQIRHRSIWWVQMGLCVSFCVGKHADQTDKCWCWNTWSLPIRCSGLIVNCVQCNFFIQHTLVPLFNESGHISPPCGIVGGRSEDADPSWSVYFFFCPLTRTLFLKKLSYDTIEKGRETRKKEKTKHIHTWQPGVKSTHHQHTTTSPSIWESTHSLKK